MDPAERRRIKELLKKSRVASKKKYMRKGDRMQVMDGILAMKKLGIYNKPAYEASRKEPRRCER